jgi:hypothetical protein
MVSMGNTLPCWKRLRKYALNTAGNKLINKGLSPIMARKVRMEGFRSFQEHAGMASRTAAAKGLETGDEGKQGGRYEPDVITH